MSQSKLSKSLLPYAIGFCALALLTSCGSRSGKGADAPAASASPQATARSLDERKIPGSDSLNGNENENNGPEQPLVDSRDANDRMDRESLDMRAANEREKQRAARLWRNSAKKDREILDAFVDTLGNEKSNRGLRDRIYKLAKNVSQGKHNVSKSGHRKDAAKIHKELTSMFKESLNKSIGGVKECSDVTAARQSSGIVLDRDLVLACTVSQGVVYELMYKAFSEIQFGQPAAGLELAHVEVSASEERFRGQRAELEVVMVSSQAHIFKGENKRAAICRKMLSYVRSTLRACENGDSGPSVGSNPCNGGGTDGNGGPCVTDVPVTGEVIVCDDNGCIDKRVNSTTRYRIVDQPAPRVTVTPVPAPRATVPTTKTDPAPVVTNCGPRLNPDGTQAPVVPGMEDCDEESTATAPGTTPTAPGTTPTAPGTQPGIDDDNNVSDVNDDGETI